MMSKPMKTPGVYIQELDAFGNAIAPVPTAIPAFIGYTEQSTYNGKSIINKPIRINSLAEFRATFENSKAPTRPTNTFTIKKVETHDEMATFSSNGVTYALSASATIYKLHHAIELFYANGGETCYIISIGNYTSEIKLDAFTDAITLLTKETAPTMLVIPDAEALRTGKNTAPFEEQFLNVYALQTAMINHCGTMKNRVAILDVPGGYNEPITSSPASVTAFRNGVAPSNPFYKSYSVAYYPWLHTRLYDASEITYRNIDSSSYGILFNLLTTELKNMPTCIDEHGDLKPSIIELLSVFSNSPQDEAPNRDSIDTALKSMSAIYPLILSKIKTLLNLMPPSPAMAGVYTSVDTIQGVWKAPANVGLQNVIAPVIKIDNALQKDLNVPLDGKSICAIRSFPGMGVMVWGARTLDGNSNDFRYINVRRTLIYLEESIKVAAKAYIFEPNDASTWNGVKSMISNFLTGIWKEGGLVGAKPADAFSVSVGLGSTMTNEDIQQGIMRVSVKVAVVHPAEFVVITFQQEMQKA